MYFFARLSTVFHLWNKTTDGVNFWREAVQGLHSWDLCVILLAAAGLPDLSLLQLQLCPTPPHSYPTTITLISLASLVDALARINMDSAPWLLSLGCPWIKPGCYLDYIRPTGSLGMFLIWLIGTGKLAVRVRFRRLDENRAFRSWITADGFQKKVALHHIGEKQRALLLFFYDLVWNIGHKFCPYW